MWKVSAVSEIKENMSIKSCIPIKISKVKDKGMKPVPLKWVFNSKEYPDLSIRFKSRNAVKGYMKVPGVNYI